MVRKKVILALLASAMMFTALAPHTIAAETSYVNLLKAHGSRE